MLRLNLLPPEEREELRLESLNQVFIYYFVRILTLIIVFEILLLSILSYLAIQARALDRVIEQTQKSQGFVRVEELEKEIISANKMMQQFYSLRQNSISFSSLLEDLAEISSSEIQFISLNYDGRTQRLALDGYTLSRESFLSLREAIESDSRFEEVESPISNLVRSTDNNFRISFKIKQNQNKSAKELQK